MSPKWAWWLTVTPAPVKKWAWWLTVTPAPVKTQQTAVNWRPAWATQGEFLNNLGWKANPCLWKSNMSKQSEIQRPPASWATFTKTAEEVKERGPLLLSLHPAIEKKSQLIHSTSRTVFTTRFGKVNKILIICLLFNGVGAWPAVWRSEGNLLPHRGSWGSNLDHQAWRQAPSLLDHSTGYCFLIDCDPWGPHRILGSGDVGIGSWGLSIEMLWSVFSYRTDFSTSQTSGSQSS